MKFERLTFEEVKNSSLEIEIKDNNSYLLAYPEFILYFNNIETIELHHLIIASHFSYGWMPTILALDIVLTNKKHINKILKLFNQAKEGHKLVEEELSELKKVINNSVVGLSKLLHFINPELYPIIDSRIYQYIKNNKSNSIPQNLKFYIEYQNKLIEIVSMNEFKSIYNNINKVLKSKYGYELSVSKIRVAELILFNKAKKDLSDNN